jgi:hypothetical protein
MQKSSHEDALWQLATIVIVHLYDAGIDHLYYLVLTHMAGLRLPKRTGRFGPLVGWTSLHLANRIRHGVNPESVWQTNITAL